MTSAEGMINKGGPGACSPTKFSKFKHCRMQSDGIMNGKIWQTPGFHCGQHKEENVNNLFQVSKKNLSNLNSFVQNYQLSISLF